MKVAVLLTGFLRTYQKTFLNLDEKILKNYDCDVFSITWNKQEGNNDITDENYSNIYKNNLKKSHIINYEEYLKTKKTFVPIDRELDVFKINDRAKEHGSYWVNRLMDQWKLVYECFNLIDDYNKYDLILRLRYDLILNNIKLDITNKLVIPKDVGGWSFTDHMAYGNPDVMRIYCNLYNNIEKLYVDDNIDVSHAVDMPKHYIIKNNVNFLIDYGINYSIFK
jgi:hypothetical protein